MARISDKSTDRQINRSSDIFRFTFYGFRAENTPAARREQGKAACSTETGSLHRLHETNERGQIMIRAIIFSL
jgi:regulation of enolase protein 1 (concanavalin A-like superfamily)